MPDVSVLRTIRTRVLAVVLGAFAAVILIGLGALTFVLLSTLRAQAGSTAQATAEWIAEVRSISCSPRRTRFLVVSTTRSPHSRAPNRGTPLRRNTACRRAASTTAENGLVT
ncbi:hypothetical protein GCM10028781_03980 [Nostocoides australiense]